MIGIDFLSFLILAAISVVVVAVKAIATRGASGRDPLELGSDLAVAWVGGWLGSPVFGHWFEGVVYRQTYIIPALVGAIAALLIKTAYYRPRPA